MYWEHIIAEYLGASVREVLDLDVVDFLALRREAYIAEMSKTKEGREYLQNCKLFESDETDYDGLSDLFEIQRRC